MWLTARVELSQDLSHWSHLLQGPSRLGGEGTLLQQRLPPLREDLRARHRRPTRAQRQPHARVERAKRPPAPPTTSSSAAAHGRRRGAASGEQRPIACLGVLGAPCEQRRARVQLVRKEGRDVSS
jgi:hypothetical protein